MAPLHVGMRVRLSERHGTKIGVVVEVNTKSFPDRPIARVRWDTDPKDMRTEAYCNYWQDKLTPINYDPHAPD